jgi:ribosomal protein L11 methyltransferase
VIRLAVRVARGQAEVVLAELLELAPGGVEEVERDDGTTEYAVYGSPGELPALPDLHALAGDALVEVSSRPVAEDWQERWKRFHRPVLVRASAAGGASPAGEASPSVVIRPPWERAPGDALEAAGPVPGVRAGEQRLEIVIDPGQAFGTGAHATTRLCLALLLELSRSDPRRGSVLDVGTGSGVLAITARALSFKPVLALDNDPASVHAAADNAAVNGVELDVRRHDLRAERLPRAHVVLANLVRPLLLALAGALHEAPAHLIAGGLLREEADEVVGAFSHAHGLHERRRLAEGEWTAVWLSRPR